MKRFILLLALSVAYSVPAVAEVIQVPEVRGKLHNYSSLPTKAFRLTYSASCFLESGDSCGEFEVRVPVAEDGSYVVPAFQLGSAATAEGSQGYSLWASMSIPDTDPGYPYGAIPADIITVVDRRTLVDPADLLLPAFTLLETQATALDVVLANGADVESWLAGEGRDLGARITLNFDSGSETGMVRSYTYDQTGFSLKDWTQVKQRQILLAGPYPANAALTVEVDIRGGTYYTRQATFTSDLNKVVGPLRFDPAGSAVLPGERLADGRFGGSYLFLDYEVREQFEFADFGYSYATTVLTCVDGRIEGQIIYRSGQFEDDPETGREAITGTCSGEKGTLRIPMRKTSGETLFLEASFDRIMARLWEKRGQKELNKLFMSEDVAYDRMRVFSGEELTTSLPLLGEDGSYYGYLNVGN